LGTVFTSICAGAQQTDEQMQAQEISPALAQTGQVLTSFHQSYDYTE
jgi:hypothetical protein